MHEVRMGRSDFKTIFENEKGHIILQISELDYKCNVALIYVDNQNLNKVQTKAIDDL